MHRKHYNCTHNTSTYELGTEEYRDQNLAHADKDPMVDGINVSEHLLQTCSHLRGQIYLGSLICVHHRRPLHGQNLATRSVGRNHPHAIRLDLHVRVFVLRVEHIRDAFSVDAQATPSYKALARTDRRCGITLEPNSRCLATATSDQLQAGDSRLLRAGRRCSQIRPPPLPRACSAGPAAAASARPPSVPRSSRRGSRGPRTGRGSPAAPVAAAPRRPVSTVTRGSREREGN